MSTDDKIVDRIKKMLALANDAGATEAERETALRMAYNTMAKHNLSLEDLPADQQTEVREEHNVVISADKWARSLSGAVARLFFTKYFYMRTNTSGKDKHYFIGRQSNAITARYMSEYLIKSIKREASSRYMSPTSPNGRSFCVGAINSILFRIDKMLESDTESTPGTALALVSIRKSETIANDLWAEKAGHELTTKNGRSDNSLRAGAFYDGRTYGKTVSLNQQISGTKGGLKQLN